MALPSTTAQHLPLPKDVFYRELSVKSKLRQRFVDEVASITVVGSISPTTANLADGQHVHEILLIDVEPKEGVDVSDDVYLTIEKANGHKKLFVREDGLERVAIVGGQVIRMGGGAELSLLGRDLDQAWDCLLAQVYYGEKTGTNIEARILRDRKIQVLEAEATRLEERARKETQRNRKNDLFNQARQKCHEVERLRAGQR